MREILFRGKGIDGNWYYGVPLVFTDDYVCMTAPHTYNKKVEQNTLGQFTGLTDKNGKKIFEGDIIKHFNGIGIGLPDIYEICEIRWNKNEARFESIHHDKKSFLMSNKKEKVYEVIGNIHDNPELLLKEVAEL